MKTIAQIFLLPFAALGTLPVTGCTYLPVEGGAEVRAPAEFESLTQGELGPTHAYVVGIAPARLTGQKSSLEAEREQAVLASLDAETVPVRADPEAPVTSQLSLGPTPDQRARAEEAVEQGVAAGPTGEGRVVLNTPSVETSPNKPLPTTAAASASTADLNNDGFITLDEVIALHRARVAPEEIARRIRATRFVLAATPSQIDHLRAYGLPDTALAPFNPQPPRTTQGKKSSVEFWNW